MTKLALKGLLSRKLRSVLTGFAVVIGVGFVVGTLVFTDTIDESFKNLFERTQQGVDVAVEARQAVKSDFSVPPTMPADTLEKVKATPGVEFAEGGVSSDGTLLDKEGEPIVSNGPPTLLVSENTEQQLPGARLRERRPAGQRRRGRARPRHGEQVRLQGRRHGHGLGQCPGQAVQGLGHRVAGRPGQPGRRAAGRDDDPRDAAHDRPRRL